MVKDQTIAHAIIDAYSVASIKERSPEVHLFIEMPLDAVDVNVHPTKAEVRFRDQSFVHSSVRMAVADALERRARARAAIAGAPSAAAAGAPSTLPLPATPYPTVFPSRWTPASPAPASSRSTGDGRCPARAATERVSTSPGPPGTLMPLGQFRDTFIIAVDEEGIAIIDQHVAHERVLFERITERLTAGRSRASGCWSRCSWRSRPRAARRCWRTPTTWSGSASRSRSSAATRCASPPVRRSCSREECRAALRALAEDLEQLDRGRAVVDAVKRIAATMACHAAVKANYPLTHEKMAHILDGCGAPPIRPSARTGAR